MPRIALVLPPGSGRQATPQDTRRAWWDMSLVRWVGDVLGPVGGWKHLPGLVLPGQPRGLLSWRDNTVRRWVAAATLGQVQVWDGAAGHVISPGDFVAGSGPSLPDGYGVGPYGAEAYGVHRSMEAAQYIAPVADSIALDNWGENLLIMGSADGRLLQWAPVLPVTTLAVPVVGAPRGQYMLVTEERHIVVIGADGDPRRVSWCSQEIPTDWVPTTTNTAGSLQLRSTGAGISGRRVSQGNLIFCDDDVHLLRYVGTPYVYGLERVGTGCGPAGPEAMVAMSGRCAWWAGHQFWLWDGSVQPLDCPLAQFLEADANPILRSLTYGYHNGLFPEITWGYCSQSSPTPDHYVTWNYQKNRWWHGQLDRSIGTEPGAYGLPLLGRSDGTIFSHETGWMADGTPRGATVYAETGDLQDGEGDQGFFLHSIVPDMQRGDLVQFKLVGQWEPEGGEDALGTYTLTRADGLIDACVETRSLRFRIEGVGDGPWGLGRIRIDVRGGTGR